MSTARLTPRERQVLALVNAGRTQADIAAELGISINTVIKHEYRIRIIRRAPDRPPRLRIGQ